MSAPTFFCAMCNSNIPLFHLISHISRCYITFCKEAKIQPLCTCGTCNGDHAHVETKRIAPSLPVEIQSPPKQPREEEGFNSTVAGENVFPLQK